MAVMNKGRARELQQLFHEAMELPDAERVAFLADASSSDPELSSVVEDLIRASSSAGGFLADENREGWIPSFSPSDKQPHEGAGSASAPQEGEVLGDYEILEKIGGNMGLVFKARHRLLDKVVALKVLPADWTADSTRLARFQKELRIMGQLQHQNLVAAFDARVEGRWHLVAMEFIEGLDLDRLIDARGPLPVAAACEAARQAALGLEHAHQRGLIHRDIKPSNLMLTPTGTVKVIDLGLALIKGKLEARVTETGVVMGTVSYCAPEQFRDASRVDIRADVYSLGCTLFHLLTGERPYGEKASLVEVMQAHLNEPFPALHEERPDAPPGLVEVLARMTAKDPAGRFESAHGN